MARTNDALVALARRVLLPNYRPPPLVLTEGEGCRVRDVEGRELLDFSGGIAVLSVGHAHPRLADAIAAQARRLVHTSNLFYNDRAIELAAALVARTPFDRVYFANSGAEANEALLKLARRWHHDHGRPERVEIVSAEASFHGRTMGALALTGQPKYHVGMGPMVGGVRHVPYGEPDAMRAAIGPTTAAVLLEPMQGEGGLVTPPPGYLAAVRALCDERGALLFFDEVQTGIGRTGTFLGAEHDGVVPDGCSLAKGMGGGFPIGAMLVREALADGLPPGSHASTFGGNPLACAAALAVLSIVDDEGLVENARAMGERLGAGLEALAREHACVAEARGRGLLRGVRIEGADPLALLGRLRDAHGMLASLAGGDVIRLAPPLTVSAADVDEGLARLRALFAEEVPT
ncbi:MAG: acetylornithine/succinylornithine family transaminase [Sandaracinaceae bacterium]|nr:acetylornithine/succinylornithine family transaminase [Sandaracinaceae bacterium]